LTNIDIIFLFNSSLNLNSSTLLFLLESVKSPRLIGALLPSTSSLAEIMVSALQTPLSAPEPVNDAPYDENIHLIELGPGTGQITQALPKRLLELVELNTDFCNLLRCKFPGVKVTNISAVDFLMSIQAPVYVVSSIPLINNPLAESIKNAISIKYKEGLIKKLVTYSYGARSPFTGCGFANEVKFKYTYRNFPPAQVWSYS
jgi:phosphatidylethanolamine/phosphatidyl-N-methylethanolamine N-methyltransferase